MMAAADEAKASVEEQPTVEVPPVEQPKEEAKPVKEKKAKVSKEKRPRQPRTAVHPPYFQMIKEALLALNEKSGSSPYAIAKFMEEKHKAVLPANYKKILSLQLKNSVARGKLIKIKASYKLSEAGKKENPKVRTRKQPKETKLKSASATATTKAKAVRKKAEKVNKVAAAKPRAAKKTKSTPKKPTPKQPKSIKSPAAKKLKKGVA